MLAFFIARITCITEDLKCLTDAEGCPEGYTKVPINSLTTLELNSATKLFIVKAPAKKITIKKAAEVSEGLDIAIEGISDEVIFNAEILEGTSIKKLSLKNIAINFNEYNEKIIDVIVEGKFRFVNYLINAEKLTINNLSPLTENAIIYMCYLDGISPILNFIHNTKDSVSLLIKKEKAFLKNVDSEFGLTIKSLSYAYLRFNIKQSNGDISIKKYCGLDLNSMFKFNIESNGGTISFENQDWSSMYKDEETGEDYSSNFIDIKYKAASKIILAGTQIPVSIENQNSNVPLEIICESEKVSIKGHLKLCTGEDIIKKGSSITGNAEIYFDSILSTIDGNKLNADDGVNILHKSSEGSLFAPGVKHYLKYVNIRDTTIDNLELSTDSVMESYITYNRQEKKYEIQPFVLTGIKIPSNGKVSFLINGYGLTTFPTFNDFKMYYDNPVLILSSSEEFDYTKFSVKIVSYINQEYYPDIKMPSIVLSYKKEKNGLHCLYAKFANFPQLPLRYNVVEKADISRPNEIEESQIHKLINDIPETTTKITLYFQTSMTGDTPIDLSGLKTKNAIIEFLCYYDYDPTLNIKLKPIFKKGTIQSISFVNLNVELSETNTDEVSFSNIPYIKLGKTKFTTKKGTIIMEYNNLCFCINEIIDLCEISDNSIVFKKESNTIGELQKEKILGKLKIEFLNIRMSFVMKYTGTNNKIDKELEFTSEDEQTITFDNTWDSVTFDKPLAIDRNFNLVDFPENGKLSFNYWIGDFSIKGDKNIINFGNQSIKYFSAHINKGTTVNFDSIRFIELKDYKSSIYVDDKSDVHLPFNVNEIYVNEDVSSYTYSPVNVKKSITMNYNSLLELSELLFEKDNTAEIIYRYDLKNKNIPYITADKITDNPSKIRAVYTGTKEDNEKVNWDEYINELNTILISKMDMETCNKWKDLVAFESESEDIKIIGKAVCNNDVLNDEKATSLSFIIENIEQIKPSKPDDNQKGGNSGLGTGEIVGITVGVIAAIAIIGFLVYWFAFRNKEEEENEENPEV